MPKPAAGFEERKASSPAVAGTFYPTFVGSGIICVPCKYEATRRKVGRAQTTLEAGALRLDQAQHKGWMNNEEVALTSREFALLQEL